MKAIVAIIDAFQEARDMRRAASKSYPYDDQ
jgi:hypothetical protein